MAGNEQPSSSSQEELRNAARKRIKAKRDFWSLTLTLLIVTGILNAIWFLAGDNRSEYYWPMWPMLGFAIAIFFTALNAYGPTNRPISDAEIDRELRRYDGK